MGKICSEARIQYMRAAGSILREFMFMKSIFTRIESGGTTVRRLNLGSVISLLVLAIILVVASTTSYILITDSILETAIDNLQELSSHDEKAILSSLNRQWDVLDGIGYNLGQRNIDTTDELFEQHCGDDRFFQILPALRRFCLKP